MYIMHTHPQWGLSRGRSAVRCVGSWMLLSNRELRTEGGEELHLLQDHQVLASSLCLNLRFRRPRYGGARVSGNKPRLAGPYWNRDVLPMFRTNLPPTGIEEPLQRAGSASPDRTKKTAVGNGWMTFRKTLEIRELESGTSCVRYTMGRGGSFTSFAPAKSPPAL